MIFARAAVVLTGFLRRLERSNRPGSSPDLRLLPCSGIAFLFGFQKL